MQQILVPLAFAVNSAKKRVANLDDMQIQNKVTDLVRNTGLTAHPLKRKGGKSKLGESTLTS